MKFFLAISIAIAASKCSRFPTVSLDGSESSSENGPIVNWRWYQVSGGATVIFDNPNGPVVNVTADKPVTGEYIIGLEVIDSSGNTGTGTSVITVTK